MGLPPRGFSLSSIGPAARRGEGGGIKCDRRRLRRVINGEALVLTALILVVEEGKCLVYEKVKKSKMDNFRSQSWRVVNLVQHEK